ncbi:hypothetical protein DMB66_27705 [Actinoplanes sp. ATCC 53533]|uniref:hypothetical protein n=1 Tax=Actinoplanes sp. ATCC 53533 TaxID=1288362 RepID=UPI000F786A1A|nr:hypothetical protein [Actinoplanes sp. ATCC 53533]RSM59473.1 hypothetical protein DMB66_27705 [Actinoplanes sp. ATCC 53533]
MNRTMARLHREPTPHTDWCARDHRCGINEHRAPDVEAREVGGRAWLTRTRAGDVEYAEVRVRIPLHSTETGARWQLALTLRLIRDLLTAVAVRPGITPRAGRPAVDSSRTRPAIRRAA